MKPYHEFLKLQLQKLNFFKLASIAEQTQEWELLLLVIDELLQINTLLLALPHASSEQLKEESDSLRAEKRRLQEQTKPSKQS